MSTKSTISFILLLFFITTQLFSASIDKAKMLNKYGLNKEAKKELIDVVFSKTSTVNKAEAYYLLGSMAFEENKISVALYSWRNLSEKYPESKQAKQVKDRIQELSEIVGDSVKESIKNAVALSYLRHGDFWSRGKNNTFLIDSSWLPHVKIAIKWYDKVIKEFPKTTASKIAYQDKIRTLLGWKTRREHYGVKKSFDKYMPILLKTFYEFEKDHPTASTLQALRYQIAQVYWGQKKWNKTREWLNIIIKKSGKGDSFYKDLSKRRLKKVEY